MASPVDLAFTHRENRDGAMDSICRRCHVTVCTSLWEADLERAEKDHACDPAAVERWSRLAESVSESVKVDPIRKSIKDPGQP